MRTRYPYSRLWKLEEARMHSHKRDLTTAVDILLENVDSHMKQITAVNVFELALSVMFMHNYDLCVKYWVQLAELSSWAPALYSYIVGAAYVELYRNQRRYKSPEAANYKLKAVEYFKKVPFLAGRQKIMARDLPFETLVVRKIKKWDGRATAWDVELIDAIGVSPLAEMIYLWNGMKKQSPELLDQSMDRLDWCKTTYPEKHQVDPDELALHGLLRAGIFRNLERHKDAKALVQSVILSNDSSRANLEDDWILPSAHYEMACLAWAEKDFANVDHEAKVLECEHSLTTARKWPGPYTLDTRMSFRISASLATVKRHMELLRR